MGGYLVGNGRARYHPYDKVTLVPLTPDLLNQKSEILHAVSVVIIYLDRSRELSR